MCNNSIIFIREVYNKFISIKGIKEFLEDKNRSGGLCLDLACILNEFIPDADMIFLCGPKNINNLKYLWHVVLEYKGWIIDPTLSIPFIPMDEYYSHWEENRVRYTSYNERLEAAYRLMPLIYTWFSEELTIKEIKMHTGGIYLPGLITINK